MNDDALLSFVRSNGRFDETLMRVFDFDRLNVMFVENQKAGCTTIKQMLLKAEHQDERVTWKSAKHDCIAEQRRRMSDPDESWRARFRRPGVFCFAVSRNPFDRLVSCWADKFYAWTKRKGLSEEIRRQKIAFIQSRLGLEGDDYQVGFDRFIDIVVHQDNHERDKHWRLQARNLGIGVVPYEHVGRIEDFDETVRALQAAAPDVVHTAERANRRSHLVDRDALLTPANRDKIYRAYEEDFDVFRYARK